ncbi:MAG: ferritin family protein [Candidatus Dadabacteria bacterium]|nr:MAG: ferritin family protein [Candidatus Dadabacteria bacterium]
MLSGKEDLLQSLIEAFAMEKGTREFYREAAEKAVNNEARKTFQHLSEWEAHHMEYIQFLYQAILGDRDLASFEEFEKRLKAPLAEGGIPVEKLLEKFKSSLYTDDAGALGVALEIEGRACNLYRRLGETAQDENARVFLKEMVAQELRHIEYLRALEPKLC